jgi:hypothetical protein
MRGLLAAALVVITFFAALADDDVDTNVDECALLAVRQTVVHRSSLDKKENTVQKGRVVMQHVFASFNNEPISSFEWLYKMLGVQKSVLDNETPQETKKKQLNFLSSEVATRACENDMGPCWNQLQGPLVHQPEYPYEQLLDDDFIHNSGNWLDDWMEKHIGVKKAAKEKREEKEEVKEKENLAFSGACFIRTTEPLGNAHPGTECLFGIVAEDEGSHCIYDNGKYGAFGWCFTDADKKEWGSCAESCPSSGNAKVLVAKIEKLQNRIVKLLLKLRDDSKAK